MKRKALKRKMLGFILHLEENEYAANSVKSYQKDVTGLIAFLLEQPEDILSKNSITAYKRTLTERLSPASVNRHIASINKFLKYAGLETFCLKMLKIQVHTVTDSELSSRKFEKLILTAFDLKRIKIGFIMLALAGMGLRISELKYITVEAVRLGKVVINNKGKIRTVMISAELQDYLINYCQTSGITQGVVFLGRDSRPISRSWVSQSMKAVADQCGIDSAKVFPHNLRHYFARRFLDAGNPLTDLADALGHKSIDTTRRYLRTSEATKRKQIARMKIFPHSLAPYDLRFG